jgi:hypothetical protein
MTEIIARTPLNILEFLSHEEHQVLVSMLKMREEFETLNRMDGLFAAAMGWKTAHTDDLVVFQLLTFAHYHYLFAVACLMRCHLAEAFASARAAIDAALIAAYIIKDRAAQEAYANRERPFDNFARHLGHLRAQGKLPHPLMEKLISHHKQISSFAVHADIGAFMHRVRRSESDGGPQVGIEYFQFARDDNERKVHNYTLIHTFVMVLDVFSDFLVNEQSAVPAAWKEQLHAVGGAIEKRVVTLRAAVKAAQGKPVAYEPGSE